MNAPIVRLFGIVLVLFALLVAFTSRWTVFEADSLRDNPLNRRALLAEERIRRGLIRAGDGTLLAANVARSDDRFVRRYPTGGLFSHAIGYSYTNLGRAGLERSRNDALTGAGNELGTIVDELRGRRREGDDVRTTLDPEAQRVALEQLAGRRGAVAALDPRSGAVTVMASVPGFDPNRVPATFRALSRDPASPLFNRTTQSGYPPGSTFKVVTAVAGIDSGAVTPETVIDGRSPIKISGVPLANDGGESFGPITLATALTHSVNTVFAQLGEKLGKRTMGRYMKRFGFYADPKLDYPSDQMAPSGEYYNGRLLHPLSPRIDVGRMAIGQDKLQVTPIQMAQVAAAVANGGRLMRPHLTDRIVDKDGRTVETIEPRLQARVMSSQTARQVGAMMGLVVREGTGTAAALQGIDVAGKTGTAEAPGGLNQVWFIAFAPADRPRAAIAVTVERSTGFGGTVAAPIAKAVLEVLLRNG